MELIIVAMTPQRLTGILFIAGSLLFLMAAFSPASRIFGEPDISKKLEIIMNGRKVWNISQWLFALGSIIVAIAVGLSSYQFRTLPGSAFAYFGFITVLIGSLLWSYHVYLRGIDPTSFVEGLQPNWHFVAYTLLTIAGLVSLGLILLRSQIQIWVGWTFIIGSGLFFILYVVFKDMPPFVYYLLTLILGIVMIL